MSVNKQTLLQKSCLVITFVAWSHLTTGQQILQPTADSSKLVCSTLRYFNTKLTFTGDTQTQWSTFFVNMSSESCNYAFHVCHVLEVDHQQSETWNILDKFL